jgi:hypothetical protein
MPVVGKPRVVGAVDGDEWADEGGYGGHG